MRLRSLVASKRLLRRLVSRAPRYSISYGDSVSAPQRGLWSVSSNRSSLNSGSVSYSSNRHLPRLCVAPPMGICTWIVPMGRSLTLTLCPVLPRWRCVYVIPVTPIPGTLQVGPLILLPFIHLLPITATHPLTFCGSIGILAGYD